MKSVLITGAGKGFGLELVKQHLYDGWQVFALPHHFSENLEDLKGRYSKMLHVIRCDVGDIKSVKKALCEVEQETNKMDRIINNAGINRKSEWTTLDNTDLDFMMEEYNVNALGAIRVIKESLGMLGKGTIVVNVSSEAGGITEQCITGGYGYCMSKAALNMGTKILNNWLREKGICFLAVHPGRMRTSMGGIDSEIDSWESAQILMETLENIKNTDQISEFISYNGSPMLW